MPVGTMRLLLTVIALVLGGASVCNARSGYVSGQPSFDCAKARNSVALILCRDPEAARADWEFNSATWAYYFSLDDGGRARLAADERAWRQSLDGLCLLPPPMAGSIFFGSQM